MKTLLLSLALATAALAADPPPSIVWQGKAHPLAHLVWADDAHLRTGDGHLIPLHSVPALLRRHLPERNPPLIVSNRIIQVLRDGLLLARTVPGSYGSPPPALLRGHPRQGELVDGEMVECEAVPDGRHTYTTVSGAESTIPAWRYAGAKRTPSAPARSPLDRR